MLHIVFSGLLVENGLAYSHLSHPARSRRMSSTLISIADLHALPAESRVVVDCRHSLNDGNYGRAAYATSHISGAYFLH